MPETTRPCPPEPARITSCLSFFISLRTFL
jgi:hypothetical protein